MNKYNLWGFALSFLFINYDSQALGAEYCRSPSELLEFWKNCTKEDNVDSVRKRFDEFGNICAYDDLMQCGVNPFDIKYLSSRVFPHVCITLNNLVINLMEEALVDKYCPIKTLKINYSIFLQS